MGSHTLLSNFFMKKSHLIQHNSLQFFEDFNVRSPIPLSYISYDFNCLFFHLSSVVIL